MIDDAVAVWLWPVLAGAVILAAAVALFVRTRRRRTVFISYRRSDSLELVTALNERLRLRFGSAVFRDQGSIPFGEQFPTVIARRLHAADVVLVVIGRDWLSATNERGLRLEQPDDMTRQEVERALASGARVIPLLLDGTAMPKAEVLPPGLAPLVTRNALPIATDRPDVAVDDLVETILASPVQRTPWMELLAHAAIVTVVLLFALSGGVRRVEIASVLFIVAPLFVAAAAVTVVHEFDTTRRRARAAYVPASALWLPLGLAAAVALLVVLKGLNLIDTFAPFQVGIALAEGLLGAHTGIVLSSLFENGRVTS